MKIRTFVLEDNEQIRKLITDILKIRGHEVYAFPDPSFCSIYLKDDCPCPKEHACADNIITDIIMLNINGLDFVENQKKKGCKAKNFCVISSAWSNYNKKFAKELGCKIFKKPIDINEFMNWLDECEKNIDTKRKLSDWFKTENRSSV